MAKTFKLQRAPLNLEPKWEEIATKMLVGREIVIARYLTKEEADAMLITHRPIVLQLDDGNLVYPMSDDEGDDGGALYTNDKKQPVIPVMR